MSQCSPVYYHGDIGGLQYVGCERYESIPIKATKAVGDAVINRRYVYGTTHEVIRCTDEQQGSDQVHQIGVFAGATLYDLHDGEVIAVKHHLRTSHIAPPGAQSDNYSKQFPEIYAVVFEERILPMEWQSEPMSMIITSYRYVASVGIQVDICIRQPIRVPNE